MTSSNPIIGISKGNGEILGFTFHSALLSISPIFREERRLEGMTIPLLSNVDGEDMDMVAGYSYELAAGTYNCIVMEDKEELRAILSLSRLTSVSHLLLLDKYCVASPALEEDYITSLYLHNEKVLRRVTAKPRNSGTCTEPSVLGGDTLHPFMDYPDGLVLPDNLYMLHSEDKGLVDAIVESKFRTMPDEALSILRQNHVSSLQRYILSNPHHSHLCLEKPFFPLGMIALDMSESPEDKSSATSVIRTSALKISLQLMYLMDVLMVMGLIPFREDIICKTGLETLRMLIAGKDYQYHSYRLDSIFRHSYVNRFYASATSSSSRLPMYQRREYQGPKIWTDEQFKEALREDSKGFFDESFDWDGFVLTGSTIFSLLLGTRNHSDYDLIRLGSGTEEELHHIYEEKFKPKGYTAELTVTSRSFRLGLKHPEYRSIDLYFGTKQSISMYHSAPTNAFFDGKSVCLYPRALHCLATGIIGDLVPLSKNRGLALRLKTYEKYREVGMEMHLWHAELFPEDLAHRKDMIEYEPMSEYIRARISRAIEYVEQAAP